MTTTTPPTTEPQREGGSEQAADAPEPAAEPAPPPAPRGRGRARRVLEWFWGGAALSALRASRPPPSGRTLELRRRAYAALELGRQALEPAQPLEHGPVEDLACQLFVQSIRWSLLARRSWTTQGTTQGPADAAGAEAGASAGGDLGVLMAEADAEMLARAAGGGEKAAELTGAIAGKSAADWAETSRDELPDLSRRLLSFAQALCDEIDPVAVDTDQVWARRLLRLGALAAGVGLLVWGGVLLADRVEQSRDLAKGKLWVASSHHPLYGCIPPAQECENSEIYFFSTNEEQGPWIEWDLGKAQTVSGVRVDNRVDCCSERAVPLVVEVSLNHGHWREVARRTEDFSSWKAQFRPTQARWVRLKVPRLTFLHLVRVRIL